MVSLMAFFRLGVAQIIKVLSNTVTRTINGVNCLVRK
jgi:hypothetical protein